jgi:hypothetical protein
VLNDDGDFVGFDVVIGNPPYISNKEMHKLQMQEIISYLNQRYLSSKSGNYDLYVPFIELGLSILKPKSEINYILPNKLMIAKYSQSLLKLIENYYTFISYTDFSNVNVFEDASVYPIVIRISKEPKVQEKGITQKISVVVNENIIVVSSESYDFLNHKLLNEKESPEGNILLKIESKEKLDEELVFSPGINGFQFTNYGTCIKEGKKENNSKRVIVTGTIDRYCILQKLVRYKGVDYKSPYIYNNPLIISPGKWELFSSPKIVVAGMTKVIEATLDEFGELAPGVSVYSITGKIEILKYVLGILNSKLINWYFRNRFDDKHLAGGYISMNTVLLQKIPLCKSKNTNQLVEIIDKILSDKRENESNNTTALENQIDQLVYKLYDLTEEEIAIVECSNK